jgi:hypothetical protein
MKHLNNYNELKNFPMAGTAYASGTPESIPGF